MAELADALDLGSSGATRTGSIPARRTKQLLTPQPGVLFFARKSIIVRIWNTDITCLLFCK